MKHTKLLLVAAFLIGMSGAITSRANANKHTLFYSSVGGVCSSSTNPPPCPGAPHVICKIGGVTYFGTSVNCASALFYTP